MGKRTRQAAFAALISATLALGACGGDDDSGSAANGGTGGNGGNGGNGGTTQPAAVQPLSGGSLYVGAVSFGDTVSVELDKPAAGQLTPRFLDSRFGLAGALVGQYVLEDGTYRVSGLAASGTDVPAALAAAAAAITFRFTLDDGVLSGALGQVPNVKAGNGALLPGPYLGRQPWRAAGRHRRHLQLPAPDRRCRQRGPAQYRRGWQRARLRRPGLQRRPRRWPGRQAGGRCRPVALSGRLRADAGRQHGRPPVRRPPAGPGGAVRR